MDLWTRRPHRTPTAPNKAKILPHRTSKRVIIQYIFISTSKTAITIRFNSKIPVNATTHTAGSAPSAVSAAKSPTRSPPSAAAAAANPSTNQQHGGNVDTLKGVRTSTLYEPGHSEISRDLCPRAGESLRLLILITSAPTHYDARLAIRQTWGSYATRRDISIGFILGSTQSTALDDKLAAENFMYGDLIRGHFLDSYNNLTLKTISSLEWVDRYCPKATFVLKTDDDMFINIPRLLAFTDKHLKDTRVIYGRLAKKWKPIRSKKSKYYVSPQQYFPPVFPPFTTGPAYLMTTDVVHDLYEKALNQTYLKLEDVFTTGIVAQLVNVKRVQVNEFMNRRIPFNPCNLRRVISVHMVKSNEQFDLWKKLLDTGTKCK